MSYKSHSLNSHLIESELSVIRQGSPFDLNDLAKFGPLFGFLSALDKDFVSQLEVIDVGGQGGRLGRHMKDNLNIHLGKYSVLENRQFVNLASSRAEFGCDFRTIDDSDQWIGPKILVMSNCIQYLNWEEITKLFELRSLAAIFILKAPLINMKTLPVPFSQRSRMGDHGPAAELRGRSQEIITDGYFYSLESLKNLTDKTCHLLFVDHTPEWTHEGSQIYNYSLVLT
jgi:hypothetical protein